MRKTDAQLMHTKYVSCYSKKSKEILTGSGMNLISKLFISNVFFLCVIS